MEPAASRRAGEDVRGRLDASFPGLAVSHALTLRTDALMLALPALVAAVAEAGGALDRLEAGAGLIRCRLTGLSDAGLDRLALRLAGLGEVDLATWLAPAGR